MDFIFNNDRKMSKVKSKRAIKEFYAIEPPFTYVVISQDRETGLIMYEVLEPILSEEEKEILNEIKELLLLWYKLLVRPPPNYL